MGEKSGICNMLLALCLTLGGCGAQEEKEFIDIELWNNCDYSLWNQELGFSFEELGNLIRSQYFCGSEE